jgi:hypothetical protein
MRIELEKFNAYMCEPYYGTTNEVLYIDERNIQAITTEDSVVPFSAPSVIQVLLRVVLQENTVLTVRLETDEDRVNLFNYIVEERRKQEKQKRGIYEKI